MTNPQSYAIRGGIEGRERLRILSRVMHESSSRFLDRLELRDGLQCLDAGCGGVDMTLELARRVGPTGKATGIDRDEAKLEIARQEARQQGFANVEYLEQKLATREEIEELTRQLYDFAEDETTLAGLPRVVQVWAQRKERQ